MLKLLDRARARLWRRNRKQKPLTLAGRFFVISMFICGHGLIDISILPLLAFVIVAFVVSLITHIYYRPQLTAVVEEPELIHLGDTIDVEVTLRNRGPRPIYELHVELIDVPRGWKVADPQQSVPSMDINESLTIRFTAKSIRRGVFKLPRIRTYSTFPFNLFSRTQRFKSEGSSVIAPARDPSRLGGNLSSLGAQQLDALGGRRSQASLEYAGSREYQPGNPVRRWDFTSWARLGTPTVCEFVEGMNRQATVIVDCQRTTSSATSLLSAEDCFEALLQTATATIDGLLVAGYDIQLYLVGSPMMLIWAPSLQQRETLMRALAEVRSASNVSWDSVADEIGASIHARAEVFAIMSQLDEPRSRLLKTYLPQVDEQHLAIAAGLGFELGALDLQQREAVS